MQKKFAKLDPWDDIEDLCREGGTTVHVLNAILLHGGLVGS
jgi:hypothetical protein